MTQRLTRAVAAERALAFAALALDQAAHVFEREERGQAHATRAAADAAEAALLDLPPGDPPRAGGLCKAGQIARALRERAAVRLRATGRRSVAEGKPDRLAAQLNEAADVIDGLVKSVACDTLTLPGRVWIDAFAPNLMDPDGWDRSDPNALDEPITAYEFLFRAMRSTMMGSHPRLLALSDAIGRAPARP